MADSSLAEAQSTTFVQKLRDGEQHWAWKMAIRFTMCIGAIVGIGCVAWLASETSSSLQTGYGFYPLTGYIERTIMVPGALAALSVSFIWCLICIIIPLLRRDHHPVHPGAIVGIDLIIWLGFIVTGLFTIAAAYSLSYYGFGDEIVDESNQGQYDGGYRLAPNGTWVYKITYDYNSAGNYYYNYTTGSYQRNNTKPVVTRSCTPIFDDCSEQDEYINTLWQLLKTINAVEIVAATTQWLGVLLHFVLFVWACVDTNRRNKSRQTQALADRVIKDMQARGLITVHDPGVARAAGVQATTRAEEMQQQPG
ncbi:hypothetical protein LTR37_013578 [Vermiconidia calcicola]|uniref:Uncharacterized protein n=1 Tax=Vermiconidia calcicola TaxID=1690605 RepID=A0ACC3MW22_9PEZI|nr:hypothetical protein LTR37_013578 [Vermiconidia calcicola]